jgi:hypothetical protein
MPIKVPSFVHRYKFWFYFRKAIFQGVIPIILAFITFIDFSSSSNSPGATASKLYFYTSLILFLYAQIRVILDFIFSICSDDVVFKKEINLANTVPDLIMTTNLSNESDGNLIIIVKKIFKLRYSDSNFFKYMYQLCWFMGIDSPVLIPADIVYGLTNKSANNIQQMNQQNEYSFLNTVLNNLYVYRPPQYEIVPTNDLPEENNSQKDQAYTSFLPKYTDNEQTIYHLKYELFNMPPKRDTIIDIN